MTGEVTERNVRKVVQQLLELVQNQEDETCYKILRKNPVKRAGAHMIYRLEICLRVNRPEEVLLLEKKRNVSAEIEKRNREVNELETEKTELEAEIISLKLRDKVYQKEHTNLRNLIAIIKYRIEKIKESIEETKRKELKDLKDFERAVDEITEKFRSSPGIYDRKSISKRLEEEEEKKKFLLQKIQETKEAYANFNKEKGLRERSNENEELLNCVLPGSELYYLIEMTKNLDEVVRTMKENAENVKKKEEEIKGIDSTITSINSKIAAVTLKATKGETQISETEHKDY